MKKLLSSTVIRVMTLAIAKMILCILDDFENVIYTAFYSSFSETSS